eukprot:CAMPEP_0170358958 /NCGR_PEP_ID=MMETSP0117_2-20130122/2497_1 /TAXON_ID=400756 /ORGANISM="Durinskia baltica, Strain CSIRO CS-38" /LENGTH=111 /DNA_ID=CAMNT_0010613185 /DNA_START=30 /DNA_END=365 /DNA_ORIENTATION=-
MDESQFKKELGKYKVVRLEDFYRPRFKKVEAKSTGSKHVHADRKPAGEKDKVKIDTKEQSFWVLMESALLEVMSASEAGVVIGKMRKSMNEVPGSINLEDLDTAASSLLQA